jgi:ubiquinone/menaquinone biosynthesis C-methylase UbiE
MSGENVQEKSKQWWNVNPMSYDWRRTIAAEEGSPEFLAESDHRFFTSSPFYAGDPPFSRLIPFQQLKAKRVLEIGCGLGAHAQLLAEAGSHLTAIDLTPTAVEATRHRIAIRNLAADVQLMDAEKLNFRDDTFDFVWSWGVIHHSSRTDQVVSEVYRVLKPGGEFRCMVYHRYSIDAATAVTRGLLSGKFFNGWSISQVLSHYTDGYIARYYSRTAMARMMKASGFTNVNTELLGQTSELIVVPGRGIFSLAKAWIQPRLPVKVVEAILTRVGSFLFVTARKTES